MVRSLMVVAVLALSPSLAAAQRGSEKCSVEAIDPVHTQRGPVLRDCDVESKASLRREPRLQFDFPRDVGCLIAEFEFVVDTTGVIDTTGVVVVVDGNNTEFVRYLRSRLGEFRYKPAKHEGALVRQVVRYRKAMKLEKLSFTVAAVTGPGGTVRTGSIGSGPALPPPNSGRPAAAACR